MEKRTLVALVLSMLVLGFYPTILKHFYPDYGKPVPAASSAPVKTGAAAVAAMPVASVAQNGGTALFTAANNITVSTENLKASVNSADGGMNEIIFLKYPHPKTDEPLKLFSADRPGVSTLALDVANGASATHTVSAASRGAEAVSTFGAVRAVKTVAFRPDGYSADVAVRFENTSPSTAQFSYRLAAGPSIPQRNGIDSQYIEANFFSRVNGKPSLRHIKETKAGKTASASGVEWVATKDRHFSVIVKPEGVTRFDGWQEGLGDHRFAAGLVSSPIMLAAGESVTHKFLFYAGPTDPEHLVPLGLDSIISFGKLDVIGKILVGALELLQKVFRNYGVAIIMLTILINILLFPLTRASYMSMKRMQLIQPQMNKVKEQNKKNPEKMNREMMELYKKHKVNPFGGCLPLLLQMPVFMALYVALSKSVSLANEKFLWIKDLSTPDSVPLPFTLPFLGNDIHLLPLIMMGAMVVQQKFTQIKIEGQDPAMEAQQKMMAVMMPLMFGFIFYTMPSGLVIYWLTNTILMSIYQWRLKHMTLA